MALAPNVLLGLPSSSRRASGLLLSVLPSSSSSSSSPAKRALQVGRPRSRPFSSYAPVMQVEAFNARAASEKPGSGRGPTHTLHVSSTTNNIILTYSGSTGKGDAVGPVKGVKTITGGSDKDHKKSNRSSYEAAHQAAIKMFGAIYDRNQPRIEAQDPGVDRITVAFKGMFGQGREAVSAALAGPEGVNIQRLVVRVEDRTPIKIGGTRAPKPRRL